MRKLLGVFALTLAIAATMGGVASAKTEHGTAPFQKGNNSCGTSQPADPVIGSAKFKRSGNKVTLSVKLTKGAANTAYSVDVVAGGCSFRGITPVHFTTNAKGKGHGTGTFEALGTEHEFFANPYPTASFEFNETPYVPLP